MIVLAIIVGLLAGLIGGFFGISGAFIIITALSYFKMVPDQNTAAGTTLLVILPPVTMFAVYHYWKKKQINFKLAYWMIGFYAVGAGIGAFSSSNFTDKQLKLSVAILFLILGIISLINYKRIKSTTEKPNLNFSQKMVGATVL